MQESIQAVRQRSSQLYNRQRSERRLAGEESPQRPPSRISEEAGSRTAAKDFVELEGSEGPAASATLTGPISVPATVSDSPVELPARRTSDRKPKTASPASSQQFIQEEAPQPGKPLTLFLQFKSKVKKVVLEDGSNDLSIARIQLAFIDKFAWNTHGNGMELPEIYIQDSVSGIRYELEDLSDIRNNSVLVLNFEPLDEVKRHIDDGMSGLRRVVEGIKTAVDNQHSAIQRIGDRQQETQKELANIAVPSAGAPRAFSQSSTMSGAAAKLGADQLSEIQTLRRNLAVMRQTYASLVSDVEASMTDVRTKAKAVKSAAVTAALPNLSGESGRAYVQASLYGTLNKEQSSIVERVDDVQDSIEDLRKDVVMRGVRPLPRQLEQVAKDLSNATSDLKKLESTVQKETPLWNKIWKQELQKVCEDREVLGETEALIADMKLDLEESEKTFRLVEEACKQQNAMAATGPAGSGGRSSSGQGLRGAGLALGSGGSDAGKARDGLLVEVKGLRVDHESRLEAIERAERSRQRELESRKEGEFKKELSGFVEEGKLKKSGGVEEAERLRKVKDDKIRREVWERQNERRAAAEAAEQAAAAAS